MPFVPDVKYDGLVPSQLRIGSPSKYYVSPVTDPKVVRSGIF